MDNPVILTSVIGASGAILAATIASITTLTIERRRIEKKKLDKFKIIQERIAIDAEIHGMLGALLGITSSDRAYIYQFHPDNNPMYFSCSYEEVRDGISVEVSNRQHLLLSQHPSFLKKLNDKSVIACNIDTMCNEHIGMLFKSQGVKVACIYPIVNTDEYLIGFVGIDYMTEHKSIDCDIKTILSNFSFKVSSKLVSYEK